ncbi:MAG: M20/M25/M40 family metallo-hydrolase [Bacillota bacterium]
MVRRVRKELTVPLVNRDRLISNFMALIRIDSESGQEGALRDFVRSRLQDLGLEVYEDGAGKALGGESGNLIAWKDGELPGPSIFFGAHMDTVVPGKSVEPVLDEGIIRSSGDTVLGGDDKAGIAAILEALQVINERRIPHPPLEVIFTVSEEQGLMGSKHLDFTRVRSKLGYVLDSDGSTGNIVVRAPTQNEFAITVIGKAAHAGINPEEGLNAICLAAYAINHLNIGRIDDETTCNLGTINGGRARNIVADRVEVKGEARSLSPDKLESLTEEIVTVFRNKVEERGGRCEVEVKHLYPRIDLDPEEPVVQIAVRAARAMGKEPVLACTGGGSDANIFNGQGIRCANLGIGMKKVHTTEEFITVDSLVDSAQYVLQIIEEAGKTGI